MARFLYQVQRRRESYQLARIRGGVVDCVRCSSALGTRFVEVCRWHVQGAGLEDLVEIYLVEIKTAMRSRPLLGGTAHI